MGKAWKFGNDVNTDEIIPARYNITTEEKELAQHVFCEIQPAFASSVKKDDVIVAGENFGCGSSREHAPIAIKGAGIRCVIAQSYARIFFRNAINIGLVLFECDEANTINEGDTVEVTIETGEIQNVSTGKKLKAKPLPEFVLKIVRAGGIIRFLKEHDIDELQ